MRIKHPILAPNVSITQTVAPNLFHAHRSTSKMYRSTQRTFGTGSCFVCVCLDSQWHPTRGIAMRSGRSQDMCLFCGCAEPKGHQPVLGGPPKKQTSPVSSDSSSPLLGPSRFLSDAGTWEAQSPSKKYIGGSPFCSSHPCAMLVLNKPSRLVEGSSNKVLRPPLPKTTVIPGLPDECSVELCPHLGYTESNML